MKSIGEILKKRREDKRLTFAEISTRTKIHHETIEALEENRFSDISGPTYVRSFLREYARFLGLDGEELVNRYKNEYSQDSEQMLFLKGEKVAGEGTKRYVFPLVILSSALITLLLVWWLSFTLMRTARNVRAKAERRVIELMPEQTLPAPEEIAVLEPEPEKTPAVVLPGRVSPVMLKASAVGDTWMQIKCDDRIIFEGVLNKGVTETWEAKEKIELWTGKAKNLHLELNGKPLGSLGEGVKRGIVITKDGMKVP